MCRQWVNISLSASCASKVKSTNGSIRKGGRSWTTQNLPSPLISIIIPKSPDTLMREKRARCEYRRRLHHGFEGRLSWDHPLLSALLPQHMGVTPNSASMRYTCILTSWRLIFPLKKSVSWSEFYNLFNEDQSLALPEIQDLLFSLYHQFLNMSLLWTASHHHPRTIRPPKPLLKLQQFLEGWLSSYKTLNHQPQPTPSPATSILLLLLLLATGSFFKVFFRKVSSLATLMNSSWQLL